MAKKQIKHPCECPDSGCPEHIGSSKCGKAAVTCVRRSDMVDRTGTLLCRGCADDMLEVSACFEDRGAWIQGTTKRR